MLLASDAVRAALISDQHPKHDGVDRALFRAARTVRANARQSGRSLDRSLLAGDDAAFLHLLAKCPPSSLDVASERLFEPSSDLWQRLHGGRPMFARTRGWLEILDACLAEPAQDRPQSVAQCRDLLGRQGSARLQVMATALGPWTDAIPAALGPVAIEPATLRCRAWRRGRMPATDLPLHRRARARDRGSRARIGIADDTLAGFVAPPSPALDGRSHTAAGGGRGQRRSDAESRQVVDGGQFRVCRIRTHGIGALSRDAYSRRATGPCIDRGQPARIDRHPGHRQRLVLSSPAVKPRRAANNEADDGCRATRKR